MPFEIHPGGSVAVPKRLARPHEFVVATRCAAASRKPGEDGRLTLGPESGVVRTTVSRAQLRRALLLLQALFAEAERRGYDVVAIDRSYGDPAGVAISVRGYAY